MRWRAFSLCLIACLMITTASAQDYHVRVTSFNLTDTQLVHIASLYDDFDFFMELIHGEYDAAYFEPEHRFIQWCGGVWDTLADSFEFHVPDAPTMSYLRRWRSIANRLDYDVVLRVSYTLRDASAILPGDSVQVCLAPAVPPSKKFRNTEVYGVSYRGGIILAIGALRDNWETSLANIVAHEYYHAAWAANQKTLGTPHTLLDRLIAEGKASTFAQMVVPQYDDPIYDGLTPEKETGLWREIKPLLCTEDERVSQRYMFGGTHQIPLNAGYTIGYRIVQTFIANHPDMSVEEWLLLPSDALYEASDYNPAQSSNPGLNGCS